MKRLFRLEQSGVIYRFLFFFRYFCGFFRWNFGEVDSHLAADQPRLVVPVKGDDGLQDCAHRKKRTFW